MSNIINGVKVPFVPITPKEGGIGNRQIKPSTSFDKIFEAELEKVKFSSHATKRLESRNIEINETDMGKLNEAVKRAESKGAKDSLVMMNETAFIVNVPNRTVVTAVPMEQSEENVFTNIDSVVFAK